MKDIQNVVNAAMLKMVESGAIEKKIEDALEGAINSAINEQFSRYGSVQKMIEKSFEEGFKFDSSSIDFDSYNAVILAGVKQKINDSFKADSSSLLMTELDKMLKEAPDEIDIHEFINTICEFWRDDYEAYYDWADYANVEILNKETSSSLGESLSIKLSIDNDLRSYSSSKERDLHLYVRKGKIRISHNNAFNPTCLSAWEGYIFKLYAAGTTITGMDDFDEGDCDLSVKPNLDC